MKLKNRSKMSETPNHRPIKQGMNQYGFLLIEGSLNVVKHMRVAFLPTNHIKHGGTKF